MRCEISLSVNRVNSTKIVPADRRMVNCR